MRFLQRGHSTGLGRGIAALVLAAALGGAQANQAGPAQAHGSVPEQVIPPSPTTPPLAPGFDVRQVEAMAQAIVQDKGVPGLAMAVVKDGRVLSARGYGTTDIDTGQRIDERTVFRLASLSKAFAGTVTGMLVAEGSLRWDAPVSDYRPDFELSRPGAAQDVTVADVLSHRVGLVRNAHDRGIEDGLAFRDLLHKLREAKMVCDPGECYAYQNVAFSLAGDIVQGASGQFFEQAVASRIFAPLGMEDASFGVEGIVASHKWARPHVRVRAGWASLKAPKPTYYRVAPAAGVNASIQDMAKWVAANTGQRPDVMPLPLLATLHSPVVNSPSEIRGNSWRRARIRKASYAMGWRVYDYAGHKVVFHGGAVQGYSTAIALIPELGFGVVVLSNSGSSLPARLIPETLDRALGLRGEWLKLD